LKEYFNSIDNKDSQNPIIKIETYNGYLFEANQENVPIICQINQ
jgi:hypothetical protein